MPIRTQTFKVRSYGLSDIGLVRDNNEDVWEALTKENFFLLADGMGGHVAGEVAAEETVGQLCALFLSTFGEGAPKRNLKASRELLCEIIKEVNQIVHHLGDSTLELRGMGTTLCCTYFHEEGLIYSHVGDSRIYQFRNQSLKRLTQDHSLASQLKRSGRMQEFCDRVKEPHNIITKAIGAKSDIKPTMAHCSLEVGDVYLMCSDGLSDMLLDEEIEKIMTKAKSAKGCVELLIGRAKEKGGNDNITAVIMQVEPSDEQATTENLSRQ